MYLTVNGRLYSSGYNKNESIGHREDKIYNYPQQIEFNDNNDNILSK